MIEASEIIIGVNAVDYSGYPDCRPAFIQAFERLVSVATRAGVEGQPIRIRTPLIALSKAEIITLGVSLGVEYRNHAQLLRPTTGWRALPPLR